MHKRFFSLINVFDRWVWLSLSLLCSTTIISTSNDCSVVAHTFIQYGSVPLEIAAEKRHTKTVQRLLDAGATVNYQNKVVKIKCVAMTQQQHISIYTVCDPL